MQHMYKYTIAVRSCNPGFAYSLLRAAEHSFSMLLNQLAADAKWFYNRGTLFPFDIILDERFRTCGQAAVMGGFK